MKIFWGEGNGYCKLYWVILSFYPAIKYVCVFVCACMCLTHACTHEQMYAHMHTNTSDSIRRIFFGEGSLNLSLKGWLRINQAQKWERYVQVVQEEDSEGEGRKATLMVWRERKGQWAKKCWQALKSGKWRKQIPSSKGLEGISWF